MKTRINSRAKGSRGEREVIKILKNYFQGKFERRSMGIAGCDIVCPEDFLWAPECKNDKMVRLKHFWKSNKKLESYWEQTTFQAKALGKRPLLCIKVEGIWFAFDNLVAPYHFHENAWLLEDWCIEHRGGYEK